MKDKRMKLKRLILSCLIVIGLLGIISQVHKPLIATATTKVKSTSSAKYPYLIKVNKKMNTVTIYKKDSKGKYTVPVKAMVCSTGANTPLGTFKTKTKYRWKWLSGNVYGQYATRITGHILFHSVYYYKKDPSTLSVKEFNKLGTSASMGCVRLQVADTKWIYDNCGQGTTVIIYNSNNPGPLGKPKAIKLGGKTKWDPTDTTNKKNPFNKTKPTIKGIKNKAIAYGSSFNPKKGVTALNSCGYDITKNIKVSGKVNIQVADTYKLTYSVTDELNRSKKQTISVTVKPMKGMPTIQGVSDRVYPYASYQGIALETYVLDGISATVGTQKLGSSYLQNSFIQMEDNDSIVQYLVTYTVTNGLDTAIKQAYITLDKQPPTITGVQDITLTKVQLETLQEKIAKEEYTGIKEYTGVTFADHYTAAEKLVIGVTITSKSDTRYTITYQVSDEAGYTTYQEATIQVVK